MMLQSLFFREHKLKIQYSISIPFRAYNTFGCSWSKTWFNKMFLTNQVWSGLKKRKMLSQ